MRQLVFDRFGAPAEVLRLAEAATPEPGPGQIRVRLTARPINPSDLMTIEGTYGRRVSFPAAPGDEGVGHVEAVGEGVNDSEPGQRVIPVGVSGTWRESVLVPAGAVLPVPD